MLSRISVCFLGALSFLSTPVLAAEIQRPLFIEIEESDGELSGTGNFATEFNFWAWQAVGVIDTLDTVPAAALSGGDATAPVRTEEAYSVPLTSLDHERLRDFAMGRHLFRRPWVAAPSSSDKMDGLGPTFNRTSCIGCHHKDGRGLPPTRADQPMKSMLIRISVPGADTNGGPMPHPAYGGQLQDKSISGIPAEGRATITYRAIEGTYDDGTPYSLKEPSYEFAELAHGPLGDGVMFSPRVAPVVYGLGLLEAVEDSTIAAIADPDDVDGDGISGRMNRVWDGATGETTLGRFGWKANAPTLYAQVAGAAFGDMGITTSAFPNDNCPPAQETCATAANGGDPELDDYRLDKLVFYSRALAVPARRAIDDPKVVHGEQLFAAAGCTTCHVPNLTTGADAIIPELSDQEIHPYTDLLLHDMGEGLADGRPDFEATGREWRTPPLWGIGLLQRVNLHQQLLHDGRARGFLEAVLWHGGEAESARDAVLAMSKDERAALVTFLRSL